MWICVQLTNVWVSWALSGQGVRCAAFLSLRTDEKSQYWIFQFSQHRCIKTLLLVLCYFGHYFLCKKVYSISVFWYFFFFNSGNWASSFSFLHATLGNYCPWHILMSVKHLIHSAVWNSLSSTVCQHYQSAMDSHSKELSHHITQRSHIAIFHIIISLEHRVLNTRDSNERKQAVQHLPMF